MRTLLSLTILTALVATLTLCGCAISVETDSADPPSGGEQPTASPRPTDPSSPITANLASLNPNAANPKCAEAADCYSYSGCQLYSCFKNHCEFRAPQPGETPTCGNVNCESDLNCDNGYPTSCVSGICSVL